jgi:hypothetical protein
MEKKTEPVELASCFRLELWQGLAAGAEASVVPLQLVGTAAVLSRESQRLVRSTLERFSRAAR